MSASLTENIISPTNTLQKVDDPTPYLTTLRDISPQSAAALSNNLNVCTVYTDGKSIFHGLWMISDPLAGFFDNDSGGGVGWSWTLEHIGNREQVQKVLDRIANCYLIAANCYPWGNRTLHGFTVVNAANTTAADNLGVKVGKNTRWCEYCMQSEMTEEQKEQVVSMFIHEFVHCISGSREALTTGCQYLYAPHNSIDQKVASRYLDNFKSYKTNLRRLPHDAYRDGFLVAFTYLYTELSHNSQFNLTPLSSNGIENLQKIKDLYDILGQISKEEPDSYFTIRHDLMTKLLEFDSNDDGAIIRWFKDNSKDFGLDELIET